MTDPLLPQQIISLLIQLPVVGVFAWLMLEIMKRQDQREERRDAAHTTERKERDEAWRQFLAEQREQNNAAVSRIAEEVKIISQEVARMNTVLTSHDAASRESRRSA